jgi:hypothetical protein
MNLVMNESTKVVAVAFADNTYERAEVVYARENILDAMPIGTPLTCSEIAEKVKELGVANYGGWGVLSVSVQRVSQCMQSLIPFGIVERVEVAVEPFEIKIPVRSHWDYENREMVVDEYKTKTLDKKAVFVRLI